MLTNQQATMLFRAFASQPDLFATKPAAYRKAAIDVVVAQLKEKDCTLATARRITAAVGGEVLLSVLDEQPTALINGLITKFDKASSPRAKSEPAWARPHLAALIEGRAEPALAVAKAKAPPKSKKLEPKVIRATHQARSMGGG